MNARKQMLIIGAGPAGLTAAYELAKHEISGTILETEGTVGGLARTIERDGYRFDIGAHRFFTKVPEIERLWDEMLGEPMVKVPRLTRILYRGRFYDYPLKARNAIANMGLVTACACMLSYIKARLSPIAVPKNFKEWVTNQFGAKLFSMFFKSYTEKVWGCPCTSIGADWAAQRIKGLNLGEAVREAIFGKRKDKTVTTLIGGFKYPRLGPGELWDACAKTVEAKGWTIQLRTRVTGIDRAGDRIERVHAETASGETLSYEVDQLFSSMPLRSLLLGMNPKPPEKVHNAASSLTYRDFLLVALIIDAPNIFPDNWIYVHDTKVRVGRIDNFGNWTPEMLPDRKTSCLVMEYFVFEGDELWAGTDEKLVEMAYRELGEIKLAAGNLLKGHVVRVPKAYPVYDLGYSDRLGIIREWLGSNVSNLQCLGRNGQHRYNNQDHSMATALIAARNVALRQSRDPWAVNEDAEYHEIAHTERQAPLTPAMIPAVAS